MTHNEPINLYRTPRGVIQHKFPTDRTTVKSCGTCLQEWIPSYASGKPVTEVASTSILEVTTAILSVFPLDTFVEHPLERMEVDQDPKKTTSVQDELLEQVRGTEHSETTFGVIPRLEFYERAKSVFAVVHTLEAAPYSVFILRKGVIF